MNFMHSLLRSPEACGLNRLSSRANLFPFPDFESAKAFKKTASPYVIDLNGTWKFRYLTDPENLTEQDFQPAAPLDGFEDTEVPDCWVMRGHGVPHYTNVVMPFPELPPEIPAENPAGIYRRTLEIPETW
ncbi:MAG: glycoside hydrolase family 2, partial [Lentisphaeria bacterium]|nr:glycoside hydrolase family 2 [Lentisphaeria bacterium]